MTKNTKFLWIVVLLVALVATFILAGCNDDKDSQQPTKLTAPKVGDKLALSDFESINDMYKIKQTNSAYDSVARFDISTEQHKTGQSSLKYSYTSGPNPELLQRYDQSNLAEYFAVPTATEENPNPVALLDASKVGATSLSIYNASQQPITATLRVIIQGNIVLLDSQAQVVEPNVWTELSFELDVLTLAKNKDSIVGISVVLGVDGKQSVVYIDNWTITVGAEATPAQQAAPVVALIDALPSAEQVGDLPSVMKVLSAKGAFDNLTAEAQGAVTNKAKLDACLPKVANYGLLMDASSELFSMVTTSGAGWDWVGNMRNIANDTYGSVVELNVVRLGIGNISEMSHQAFAKLDSYDLVKFFVYNPLESDRILRYATGQGWSGSITEFNLPAQQWTEITLPASAVGLNGGFMLIQNSQANGWLFSSIVGISAVSRAQEVERLIDALPALANATADDTQAVRDALDAYNALTPNAQKLVNEDKLAKLQELAGEFIYGEYASPVKQAIAELDAQLNGVVDSFDDIDAINVVKDKFDSIIADAKPFVVNADVLNDYLEKATAYQNSIQAVKAILATLDSAVDTFEERYRVLSAKSIFESLDADTQATLTGADKTAYDNAVTAVEGYSILHDAFNADLLTTPAPGDYHNDSEVRHSYDQRFGNVYTLKVFSTSNASNAASFKPFGTLKTTNISAVVLYVKNDTGAWQNNLAAWTMDWSNVKAQQCAGSAQTGKDVWTQILIPVEGFYSVADVFYVLNSASDGAVTNGTWRISSFMGLSDQAYNKILAQDTINMITALPEADAVTLGNITAISTARDSYDGLSAEAKATVDNYSKLVACETALQTAINSATSSINEKISALPTASEITADNVLTYRDAILGAKAAYDSAIDQVKAGVTDSSRLDACVAKLNEFMPLVVNNMIANMTAVADIDTDEERLYALYVINTFNALDDAFKAQITSENVTKINACIEKLAGYSIVADANNSATLSSGRDTGNTGTVSSVANAQFGSAYSISFSNEGANSDFHIADVEFDYTGIGAVVFYVYNPYDANINLILYDTNWGGWALGATAQARQWTRVEVDVDGTSYGEKGFFINICTGDMLGGNAGATAEGNWMVTSFMGISKETLDNLAVPGVIAQIEALPTASEVTIAHADAINSAKAAYDALTESAKANVTNSAELAECVTALANAFTAEAGRVSDLITDLPVATEIVDLTHKDAINSAKSAYEALPESAKAQVNADAVSKLNACVEALAVAQKNADDQSAADVISAQIAQLPSVDEVNETNAFATRQAVVEARATLTNASADVLAKVPQTDKDKVTALEEKLATLSEQIVNGIVESMLPASEINTIVQINVTLQQLAEFDALGETDKALLSADNATKLTAVRTAVDGYTLIVNPATHSGATVDNNGTVTTKVDATYGSVFSANFSGDIASWINFNYNAEAYSGNVAYWFAVYNPIGWNASINVVDADGAWVPGSSQILMPAGWNVYCVPATVLTGGTDNFTLMFNKSGGDWNGLLVTGIVGMGETAYNKYLASGVTAQIAELPETITYAHEQRVNDVKTAYDALDETAKAYVSNKAKLDDAIVALNASIDAEAKAVQDLIDALPEASEIQVANKAQVQQARTAYDALATACKTAYDKVVATKLVSAEEALAQLDQRTEAQKLIESIGTLPAEITTDAQRINVLQLNATIATKYNALDETDKATVDADETYKALVALAQSITDAGYSIAGSTVQNAGIGAEVGNHGSMTADKTDATYGALQTITFNVADTTGSFRVTASLQNNYEKVTFGIYNPLDSDISFVIYDMGWGNNRGVTGASKEWTFITLESEAHLTGAFIVINTTAASTVEWKVTSMLGYKAPATEEPGLDPVEPTETTTVLADGTSAGHFYVYDTKSVDNPNATMTTSTDAEHGNVYVIAYNESAICNAIGLQTMNLTLTDYDILRFVIYNPRAEDITVSVQEMGAWAMLGTQTAKAGEWTVVEFDLTNTTADVLIYINGVAGSTYKMGQLIGVTKVEAGPAESTTTVLDATSAGQFGIWNAATNDDTGVTVTVGTDADKGNVLSVTFTNGNTDGKISLDPGNKLAIANYDRFEFWVYNSGSNDVQLSMAERLDPWHSESYTITANGWTKVVVDCSKYTSGPELIPYLKGEAGVEYKFSAIVGVTVA